MVFKSVFGKWLTIATFLVLFWAVTVTAFQFSVVAAVQSLPASALIFYLVYLIFWVPRIEVGEKNVVVKNVIVSYDIPYGAIQRIDTKWALTFYTQQRKIVAFGAPAPGRHAVLNATRQDGTHLAEATYIAGTVRPGDLVTSESGAAALVIRRKLEVFWGIGSEGSTQVRQTLHRKRLVFLLIFASAVFVSLF